MSVKSFDKIQSESDQLIRVWTANPTLSLGDVTLAVFQSMVASFQESRSATQDLRTHLTKSAVDTNNRANVLADLVSRGRSVIRGNFGGDSAQYAQIGGTRTSQRRPRKAKAAVTPTATT
jgi:hypothetical protein